MPFTCALISTTLKRLHGAEAVEMTGTSRVCAAAVVTGTPGGGVGGREAPCPCSTRQPATTQASTASPSRPTPLAVVIASSRMTAHLDRGTRPAAQYAAPVLVSGRFIW